MIVAPAEAMRLVRLENTDHMVAVNTAIFAAWFRSPPVADASLFAGNEPRRDRRVEGQGNSVQEHGLEERHPIGGHCARKKGDADQPSCEHVAYAEMVASGVVPHGRLRNSTQGQSLNGGC
jgi:hypothetical protein